MNVLRHAGTLAAYLCAVPVLLVTQAATAATLQWLGSVNGLDFEGVEVSGDGTTVAWADASNKLVMWTVGSGQQYLLGPGDTQQTGKVRGISGDGSIIVGSCTTANCKTNPYNTGFRWTSAGGVEPLSMSGPYLNTYAEDISIDGTVAGGAGFANAPTVWSSTGARSTVDGSLDDYQIFGMSPDGSVIVGMDASPVTAHEGATRWVADGLGGWTRSTIGTNPNAGPGLALAASSGGGVIVGVDSTTKIKGWYWTAATGIELLDTGIWSDVTAFALSEDGSRLVGYGDAGAFTALVWDGTGATPRSLEDILTMDYGLDLAGASLNIASAISLDGNTIVGIGKEAGSTTSSVFYVTLTPVPLPAAAWLFGSGLLGMIGIAGRRKRR